MGYYGYKRRKDFEITKREVLSSIAIIAIMLLVGMIIHGKISDNLMNEYQKYNTALRIEEEASVFSYGMKTNIGNTFAYGDLKAVDTVTYDEIGGKYSYVEKIKERYTMHTTMVKSGKTYHTQTYWTWDRVSSEDKHCKKISFLDVEFDYGKIDFPSSDYIKTIKESSHVRYKYYGTGIEYKGTLYAVLDNNTISETEFYNNRNIEDTIDELETGWQLVVFWIVWLIVIGVSIFGFYYLDNKWLEDKNKRGNYYEYF